MESIATVFAQLEPRIAKIFVYHQHPNASIIRNFYGNDLDVGPHSFRPRLNPIHSTDHNDDFQCFQPWSLLAFACKTTMLSAIRKFPPFQGPIWHSDRKYLRTHKNTRQERLKAAVLHTFPWWTASGSPHGCAFRTRRCAGILWKACAKTTKGVRRRAWVTLAQTLWGETKKNRPSPCTTDSTGFLFVLKKRKDPHTVRLLYKNLPNLHNAKDELLELCMTMGIQPKKHWSKRQILQHIYPNLAFHA